MYRPVLALTILAILAPQTVGQNTATWFWTVSDTGDGDGLIEHTETALLTLSCGFDPPQPQDGGGFAAAIYDIIGNEGWAQGTVESYTNLLTDGVGGCRAWHRVGHLTVPPPEREPADATGANHQASGREAVAPSLSHQREVPAGKAGQPQRFAAGRKGPHKHQVTPTGFEPVFPP